MDFPSTDLRDQGAGYVKLVALLRPGGPACPTCKAADRARAHRRHRAPALDYRCTVCGRVSDAFTATAPAGTHRKPAEVMLILRGSARGAPAAPLARASGCDRTPLPELRRLMQDQAERWRDRNPLGDPVVEADEMHQDAREEGIDHPDPDGPPGSRANPRRGQGSFAKDRPPVAGVVGRESGEVRLEVLDSSGPGERGEFVARSCLSGAKVTTDEWVGCSRVAGRHERVDGTADRAGPRSTSAAGADGDGVREVHGKPMEGTGRGPGLPQAVARREQVVRFAGRGDVRVGP